jgi:Na+/H+-dicarboxylate symporter
MILGAALGIVLHNTISEAAALEFSNKIKILATVFIRLVQMIISPLVFTTLVVGIAKCKRGRTDVLAAAPGWFFLLLSNFIK